jgi:Zn-dependent M28 family amino/carboxypeptidase
VRSSRLSGAACALAAALACGTSSPILDGARCLAHVEKLVEIGPRPSGSPGAEKAREYLLGQLRSFGLSPVLDRFPAETKRGPMEMANVRVEIEGVSRKVAVLLSHYDTKLLPSGTFVGANDGGSSTGVLLEIARHFAKEKPPLSLRILFVDGEETQGRLEWDDEDALYGSRHEVARMAKAGEKERTVAVILLDLIGDKDLRVVRESRSSPRMVQWVAAAAAEVGCEERFFRTTQVLIDDHVPFLQAGVPEVIDLIDFDYGPNNSYWHTVHDTLDKLSAESLRLVGDVVIRTLPRIAKQYP